jgi:hypothetical protein
VVHPRLDDRMFYAQQFRDACLHGVGLRVGECAFAGRFLLGFSSAIALIRTLNQTMALC